MQHLRPRIARQVQHVSHSVDRRPEGLERILLVVRRRGRASKVVDFIKLSAIRLRDIVLDEGKARIREKRLNVLLHPREEIIKTRHLIAVLQETFAKMRPQEACAARNQSLFRKLNFHLTFSALHESTIYC